MSWSSKHDTWEKGRRSPTLPLFNATNISYTSFFTTIQTVQPSLRDVSQCMLFLKSHHYLWFNPSDLRPLLLAGFWLLSPDPACHNSLRSNNKTNKNPSNLLYLTFIGIIFWNFALIRRTECSMILFHKYLFYCETITEKQFGNSVEPCSWNEANIDTWLKKNSVFRAGKPEKLLWRVSRKENGKVSQTCQLLQGHLRRKPWAALLTRLNVLN